MKHVSIRYLASVLLMVAAMLLVSGCSAQATATPDPALVRFVVGSWTYEGDYQYRGTTYTDEYRQYTFESGKVLWMSTQNDGSQCTYDFAGPDVIRIDCGGGGRELSALSVKRDGESLLLQELDERLSPLGEQLRFTRVPGG